MDVQHNRAYRDRAPSLAPEPDFLAALAESVALAEQIDRLLANPPDRLQSKVLLRVRLARALVLGVVDQLEDLVR